MTDSCAFCLKELKTFRVRKTFYSQSCNALFSLDFCTEKCVLAYEKAVPFPLRRPSNEDLEKIAIMRVP